MLTAQLPGRRARLRRRERERERQKRARDTQDTRKEMVSPFMTIAPLKVSHSHDQWWTLTHHCVPSVTWSTASTLPFLCLLTSHFFLSIQLFLWLACSLFLHLNSTPSSLSFFFYRFLLSKAQIYQRLHCTVSSSSSFSLRGTKCWSLYTHIHTHIFCDSRSKGWGYFRLLSSPSPPHFRFGQLNNLYNESRKKNKMTRRKKQANEKKKKLLKQVLLSLSPKQMY